MILDADDRDIPEPLLSLSGLLLARRYDEEGGWAYRVRDLNGGPADWLSEAEAGHIQDDYDRDRTEALREDAADRVLA